MSVDRETGIDNCAGDLALYQKAMDYFAANAKSTYDLTSAAVAAGDHDLVHRTTHREASLAAIVGATKLARIVGALSREAKAEKTTAQKSLLAEYEAELEEVLGEIIVI